MKRLLLLIWVWLCFVASSMAQKAIFKPDYLLVSGFNTATKLPFGELFSAPVHPGFTAGLEYRFNRQKTKNLWFQTAKIGYSHHQYVQNALQLYSETGYRRLLWRGLGSEIRLGAGYLHAFSAAEVFEANDQGIYDEKPAIGRPQAMISGAFGLSYSLPAKPGLRFFLDYQTYFQLPFVKSYVPILPNTALHIGVGVPVSK